MSLTRRQVLSLTAQPVVPLLHQATSRKLFVLSVDGLDHRYLRDVDRLGLHIPTLRRLMKEGSWADGVVGELPTVTWPLHTTMVTGVAPRDHGIVSNRRPPAEGGDYYWELDLCKVPTLWHKAREAGLKTGAITWPVTVTPIIDHDLPEYLRRRRGGAMDLRSIASRATPGLIERISKSYPSFPQEWMDDRTRVLAAMYLLREERPDFLAVHLVDLDSEQHDNGPFSREACAVLEYTDELIARLLDHLPPGYAVAVVSDHGFLPVRRVVNLRVAMRLRKASGAIRLTAGLAVAEDDAGAEFLDRMAADPLAALGRRVPASEIARFAPELKHCKAAYEPADGVMFGQATSGEVEVLLDSRGEHGFWPGRPDYRAAFILWGKGVKPGRWPEMSLRQHAGLFAEVLGIAFPTAPSDSRALR